MNSNLPGESYRIFKKEAEIDKMLDDSTDIFQRNTLDRYFDRPNENFNNGKYRNIDQFCFADFFIIV